MSCPAPSVAAPLPSVALITNKRRESDAKWTWESCLPSIYDLVSWFNLSTTTNQKQPPSPIVHALSPIYPFVVPLQSELGTPRPLFLSIEPPAVVFSPRRHLFIPSEWFMNFPHSNHHDSFHTEAIPSSIHIESTEIPPYDYKSPLISQRENNKQDGSPRSYHQHRRHHTGEL